MKHVTATEARASWFRLLDEVVAGEEVVVERGGHRIVLRAEPEDLAEPPPDYSRLLRVTDPQRADRWSWSWTGPGEDLTFVEDP